MHLDHKNAGQGRTTMRDFQVQGWKADRAAQLPSMLHMTRDRIGVT